MPQLFIICPNTEKEVYTGLNMDWFAFDSYNLGEQSLECPRCLHRIEIALGAFLFVILLLFLGCQIKPSWEHQDNEAILVGLPCPETIFLRAGSESISRPGGSPPRRVAG